MSGQNFASASFLGLLLDSIWEKGEVCETSQAHWAKAVKNTCMQLHSLCSDLKCHNCILSSGFSTLDCAHECSQPFLV